eukprot:CAMPEP_0174354848 /NCGR_PEP_ID=MMETSP0811_2-20130205/21467_1 /TAXON_ID=73025 ORGANISM="Eutreptiella gymnastica-like, Strain CCMP1594" /NCGR_SAMPLE_ID=MMETSP0811_2 /ASSEMBLY_ACC=CAM_ASM_000667 /LENGTH=34 /DNA_ID= /DNA_START= /DNA_END= /DNA_ORIENTATION=
MTYKFHMESAKAHLQRAVWHTSRSTGTVAELQLR